MESPANNFSGPEVDNHREKYMSATMSDIRDITEQVDAVVGSVATVGCWLPWCHSSYSVKDAAEWFVICEQSIAAHRQDL